MEDKVILERYKFFFNNLLNNDLEFFDISNKARNFFKEKVKDRTFMIQMIDMQKEKCCRRKDIVQKNNSHKGRETESYHLYDDNICKNFKNESGKCKYEKNVSKTINKPKETTLFPSKELLIEGFTFFQKLAKFDLFLDIGKSCPDGFDDFCFFIFKYHDTHLCIINCLIDYLKKSEPEMEEKFLTTFSQIIFECRENITDPYQILYNNYIYKKYFLSNGFIGKILEKCEEKFLLNSFFTLKDKIDVELNELCIKRYIIMVKKKLQLLKTKRFLNEYEITYILKVLKFFIYEERWLMFFKNFDLFELLICFTYSIKKNEGISLIQVENIFTENFSFKMKTLEIGVTLKYFYASCYLYHYGRFVAKLTEKYVGCSIENQEFIDILNKKKKELGKIYY